MPKLTKRLVDALENGSPSVMDTELRGFGVRASTSGEKTFFVRYRPYPGGRGVNPKNLRIGAYGPLTVEQARTLAKEALAKVAQGHDPHEQRKTRRKEQTVGELFDRYLTEHAARHLKPSTLAEVTRAIEKRLRPNFGPLKLTDLTKARVKAWHSGLWETPYEANRALAYFSAVCGIAVKEWDLLPANPCIGVSRYAERKRERFLSDEELARLGVALRELEAEGVSRPCIALARILILTGVRRGEALALRWEWIDWAEEVARLPDSKSGDARIIALNVHALAELRRLKSDAEAERDERRANREEWPEPIFVFPGFTPEEPLSPWVFRNVWEKVVERAGIPNVRPHDLRHTSGTYAAQAGFNAFMIRDHLGHKTLSMTGRYVERSTAPLHAVQKSVGARVGAALYGDGDKNNVVKIASNS